MSDTLLSKKQAIEFLELDPKIFDNYYKNAQEFLAEDRVAGRGRLLFQKHLLEAWKQSYTDRIVLLDKEDYVLCLDFALAMHFRGYVASDWSTGRQREFGQKVTNWIKGQLGEIAVKKFLKRTLSIEVELDFEIRDQIVPQDIIGMKDNGKLRIPKVGIGIKSSKPKSGYLILGQKEITLSERRSDIYILCRPDIPDDHLLRLTKETIVQLVKNQPLFHGYAALMSDFSPIFCEVAGWCRADELKEVTSIPGQKFDDGTRYVIESGKLHRSMDDWKYLASIL